MTAWLAMAKGAMAAWRVWLPFAVAFAMGWGAAWKWQGWRLDNARADGALAQSEAERNRVGWTLCAAETGRTRQTIERLSEANEAITEERDAYRERARLAAVALLEQEQAADERIAGLREALRGNDCASQPVPADAIARLRE